jgi:deazaflavin-dependent oxidoreductase (nitroreductase family)
MTTGKDMTTGKETAEFRAPTGFEAAFNRSFGFFVGLGIGPKFIYLLQVPGRKSGKIYSSPVNMMEIGGRRILVAPRGRAQWVRNAEAAGEITLKRRNFRQRFALRPIADGEKPPLLKEYLDRYQSAVKKFFPVPPGSPVEAFREIATKYPVFELMPRGAA